MAIDRDHRRRQLLVSFLNTFSARGLDKTTMRDLIAESGISSSVIYEMFDGRDQMVVESARNYCSSLAETLRTIDLDPNLSLRDCIDSMEEIAVKNLPQDRFFLQVLLHPSYRPRCRDVAETLRKRLYETNVRLAGKAGVEAEQARTITSYVLTAITSFTVMADEELFRTQMERIRRYWDRCEQGDVRRSAWEK